MTRPKIIIVGGGFGGLAAAKALRKTPADVIVIDRSNHHLFQPLLYQVATSSLSTGNIAAPIRGVLGKQKNATVLMAEVNGVDKEHKCVFVSDADRERLRRNCARVEPATARDSIPQLPGEALLY